MNRTYLKVRHILDDIPTKEEFQEVIEKVKLTPRQLEILELRFIRHLLNYEIADLLGVSEKTVVRDLRKSYRMIHEILGKQSREKALQKL
ncbi:ECF-type sigma factor [Phascolarctobacterium faecium]|uniref:ECF-type sigma factor n=1 Tax=Phascolarctobacterium faecium TaxID=33025 RepID=UPI00206FDFC1|nr:MAG TPA: RNA polymerase sigma factor [Caudoviricetes sp.]